jgi:cystathionine beta-lyase/cystathionine gamma-synthase
LTKVYEKYGVSATFVDQTNLENFKKAIKKNTKIVWIETPSNPLLKITDIESVTQIAKRSGCLSIVDNTFASPYLQQPLSLGVDIVVHSTTKYLAGHSDVIGGALITNDENLYNELKFYQNTVGAVPGPQDCYLILRGVKTLSLRMERHCLNAGKVSSFLKEHPKVKKVFYPGLSAHIGHSIAKKQMRDFGGMVSFELRTDWAGVLRFTKALKIFTIAESLGTVYSLLNHPASMTHASIPKDIREKNGVTDSLLRLSLGCEDLDDLLEDLKQALTHI